MCGCLMCIKREVIDENTWQAAYTHIDEGKVGVYMFRKRFATWCVCVYICMPGGLLIKTIRHCKQANESISLWVVYVCVELAPYRSFARSNWDAFSQLAAMYKRPREKRTKACVAINSIMHAALFLLMLVDGIVVVVVCYYHRNTFIRSFDKSACKINDIDCV